MHKTRFWPEWRIQLSSRAGNGEVSIKVEVFFDTTGTRPGLSEAFVKLWGIRLLKQCAANTIASVSIYTFITTEC